MTNTPQEQAAQVREDIQALAQLDLPILQAFQAVITDPNTTVATTSKALDACVAGLGDANRINRVQAAWREYQNAVSDLQALVSETTNLAGVSAQ